MAFSFEQLEVWKESLDFANQVVKCAQNLRTNLKLFRLIDQITSSAVSVPQNIAEGKGRYSKKEFVQFLFIARGSLFETVTLLYLFQKNDWIEPEIIESLLQQANQITGQLNALIQSIKNQLSTMPVSQRRTSQPRAASCEPKTKEYI